MLYYLGKGTEFKKEECKEYKTFDGVLKAAAKDNALTAWDETGAVVGGLVGEGKVPDGALNTNPDGSVPAFDADGNPVGMVDAAKVAAVTGNAPENDVERQKDGSNDAEQNGQDTHENGENEANTALINVVEQFTEDDTEQQDGVIIPQGAMRVTVICDGTLNLRRSASWESGNVCGHASRGQSYYVKEIHTVDGKKIVRTIDDLYLSGASEHVQFEQL